jgi:hypothetical protein
VPGINAQLPGIEGISPGYRGLSETLQQQWQLQWTPFGLEKISDIFKAMLVSRGRHKYKTWLYGRDPWTGLFLTLPIYRK